MVVVTEKIDIKKPKTKISLKHFVELTERWNDLIDENLFLSARNVKNVGICNASSITPVILMKHDKILITVPALKLIEERFA